MASSQRLDWQHESYHPDEASQPYSTQPIHAFRLRSKLGQPLIIVIVVYLDFLQFARLERRLTINLLPYASD